MLKNANENRDQFSFSRGGMTSVAGFAIVPAIPHDRLRQAVKDKVKPCNDEQRRGWRIWGFGRRAPV